MITKTALVVLLALTNFVTARYEDVALNIDFQTFELDGHVHDILWCGSTDETILVQTDDGTVYRSRDRGANWKRLKSLMQKQGQSVADVDQDVSLSQLIVVLDWKSPQDCAKPS
jgi:hypothetical protein